MAVSAKAVEQIGTLEHFLTWVDQNELKLEDGSDWVLEDFQREIVADVLANYRETWVIMPEGNAKTTLMAGLAVYDGDHAVRPWIPIGAASRDQAEIMFGQCGTFIEQSDSLKARFRVYEGYRKIKCPGGGRGIKVYPWDPNTGDGVIPYPRAYVDEPHRHPDLRLYRLWKGKLKKRNASIVAISTAGEPDSEFEDVRAAIRDQAKTRERDGCHLRAEGMNLVYHEWMVPDVERARDIETVKAANPLATIDETYLAEKLGSETLDFGEDWLRLTCNIPSRSTDTAIPEILWDSCALTPADEVQEIPAGVPIMVGGDFAWLEDTTAITPLWVRDSHFRLFGDPVILEPPGGGEMLDSNEVKAAILNIHERNPIEVFVMDPSKAQDIAQWISNELGCLVVPRSQSNAFAVEDYDYFMEGLRERWIRHTGHPIFRRHAISAIRAKLPGDKYRFDRPRTLRKRKDQRRVVIDALSAAGFVNTYVGMFGESVYEGRGVLVI